MVNNVAAVMSPEACGYTTQASFTGLGFTSYALIGSEQGPALVL